MTTTLLAVDDSKTMRKVLEITFAGEDYRTILAENSGEALAKLRGDNPAVVLVDATLGDENGYDLCQKIKREAPSVCVLLLSSKQQPYDRTRGAGAGADDFIDKPFDTQQLLEKVSGLLRRAAESPLAAPRTGAAAARPAAGSAGPALGARPAAPASSPVAAPGAKLGTVANAPARTLQSAGAQAGQGTSAQARQPSPGARVPAAPVAAAPASHLPAGRPPSSPQAASPPAALPGAVGRPPSAALGSAGGSPSVSAFATTGPTSSAVDSPVSAGAVGIPVASTASATSGAGAAAGAVLSLGGDLATRLSGLGLTKDQVHGVLALSKEVVEKVVWEVVPQLAEAAIKEEIRRLTAD